MKYNTKITAHIKENKNSEDSIILTRRITDRDVMEMTFDEVEDMFFEQFEKIMPENEYPNAVIEYFISENDELYPIISESDKKTINKLKKSKKYTKFLVLTDAVYSLTEEAKLFYKMMELGLIDEDTEFKQDTMHTLLESMKNIKKEEEND